MKDLVKIERRDGVPTVNARELHEWLQVKSEFAHWIRGRIEKYGFSPNVDYVELDGLSTPKKTSSKSRAQRTIEYHLTLDMAKELAMIENNKRGQEIRRYFIAVEKGTREITENMGNLLAKSKAARNGLTATWKVHGADKPHHYINLTRREYVNLGFGQNAKKAEMSKEQLAELAVYESLEMFKLIKRPDIMGYFALADSLDNTAKVVSAVNDLLE